MEAKRQKDHKAKEEGLVTAISEKIELFQQGYKKLKDKQDLQDLEFRREAESTAAIRDWQEKIDTLKYTEEKKERERQREAQRKQELRRKEHEMKVQEVHRLYLERIRLEAERQ